MSWSVMVTRKDWSLIRLHEIRSCGNRLVRWRGIPGAPVKTVSLRWVLDARDHVVMHGARDRCAIEIDRRLLPGEDPHAAPGQLAAYLREQAPADLPFESTEPWLHCPALSAEGSADLVSRLGKAVESVIGRHEVITVPYGTDASTLAEAGIPSVVFGPGDIAQAHTKDEWIDLEQVQLAAEAYYQIAVKLGRVEVR